MKPKSYRKLPNYYLTFEYYDFGWESCKVFYIWNTQPFLLWKFPPAKFLSGYNKVTNCRPLSLHCIIYSRASTARYHAPPDYLPTLVWSKMSPRRRKCNSTVVIRLVHLDVDVRAWKAPIPYAIKNQRGASKIIIFCVPKPRVGGSGCDELFLYGKRELA